MYFRKYTDTQINTKSSPPPNTVILLVNFLMHFCGCYIFCCILFASLNIIFYRESRKIIAFPLAWLIQN